MDFKDSGNPVLEKFAKREQNWVVLEALQEVAEGLGKTPAEVALAWVMGRPCVTSTLIGASRVEQLEKNLAAGAFKLSPDAARALTDASAPEANELDHFFGEVMQGMVHGGARVERARFI